MIELVDLLFGTEVVKLLKTYLKTAHEQFFNIQSNIHSQVPKKQIKSSKKETIAEFSQGGDRIKEEDELKVRRRAVSNVNKL